MHYLPLKLLLRMSFVSTCNESIRHGFWERMWCSYLYSTFWSRVPNAIYKTVQVICILLLNTEQLLHGDIKHFTHSHWMVYSPSQQGSVVVVEWGSLGHTPRMLIFTCKLLSSTWHKELLPGKLFQFKKLMIYNNSTWAGQVC